MGGILVLSLSQQVAGNPLRSGRSKVVQGNRAPRRLSSVRGDLVHRHLARPITAQIISYGLQDWPARRSFGLPTGNGERGRCELKKDRGKKIQRNTEPDYEQQAVFSYREFYHLVRKTD